MCSYVTNTTPVVGAGYAKGEEIDVRRAVVALTHPMGFASDHALCVDFRADNGDPAERVAVELDPHSARRLAETILATLDEERL
jgi:hypothetical protein